MSQTEKSPQSSNLPDAAPPKPLQITLRTVIWVVVTVCVVLALGKGLGFVFGFVGAVLAGIVWLHVYERPWKEIVAIALIGLLAVPALFPGLDATSREREGFRRMQCGNNLRQIMIALHLYETNYGSFPPAYTVDDAGKRLHSWRTLILPYLEEGNLYNAVDFTQPWDAAANRQLSSYAPEVYGCPSHPEKAEGHFTSYVAAVGPETAWPGERGRNVREFKDGQSRTILVIEYAGSDIHWAEPRDLTLEQVLAAFENGDATGIGCYHEGGANVGFADGMVRFLDPSQFDADILRAMFTTDGEEPVSSKYLD